MLLDFSDKLEVFLHESKKPERLVVDVVASSTGGCLHVGSHLPATIHRTLHRHSCHGFRVFSRI